ncbi:MAG: alpha-amylase, partial [Flammeovirgaceae bacterium]|nr:alpha-amylase [Flammeovirgaceae bacterium]
SNHMQKDAIKKLYQLEKKVVASQNPSFLETWRNLQAHQHLFYMQTKIHSNHQILSNPFQTPFDAYISFMNILSDFELVVA